MTRNEEELVKLIGLLHDMPVGTGAGDGYIRDVVKIRGDWRAVVEFETPVVTSGGSVFSTAIFHPDSVFRRFAGKEPAR